MDTYWELGVGDPWPQADYLHIGLTGSFPGQYTCRSEAAEIPGKPGWLANMFRLLPLCNYAWFVQYTLARMTF